MILFKQLAMLERMHTLISQSSTGTPTAFARIMGVSERHLHQLIDELKDRDAPIRYSRKHETYYYTEPYEIRITCTMRRLTGEDQGKIIAGYRPPSGYAHFIRCNLDKGALWDAFQG